ncbi:MAG: alpha-ketoglutarate-dependent dioxygenase AlkB [Acidimicrobiales bacterium]
MSALQPSLLEALDEPGPGELSRLVERSVLEGGAWFDLRRSWIAGSTGLFERLMTSVPWLSERRPMYDRVVDVPRLVYFYGEGEALPDRMLYVAREVLDDYYGSELGEPLCTAGLCCYRDGRDSVAWHGDTMGRGSADDTIVAIVSVGAPRRLLIRPRGGGASIAVQLGFGDLFVMGGSFQRTFEHAVPKTTRSVGPRISVQFRARGVR